MVPETMTGMPAAEFARKPVDGEQRGLDVARVLAGLDQQEVRAAVDQPLGLLVEALAQFVET